MPAKTIPLRQRSKAWLLREVRGLPTLRSSYTKLCQDYGLLREQNRELERKIRDGEIPAIIKLDRANAMVDHLNREITRLKHLADENSLLRDQIAKTEKSAAEHASVEAQWQDCVRHLGEMKTKRDEDWRTIETLQASVKGLQEQLTAKQATISESIYRPEATRVLQDTCAAHVNTDFPALLALRPGQEPELWRLHGRISLARDLAAAAPQIFPSPVK